MPALSLIFARGHSLGSWLLRVLGNSRWSHVAVVDGDHVIEARAWHGVVRTPMVEFLARCSAVERLDVECPNPGAGLEYARSRIGCGYAWRRLLALLLHVRLPHNDGAEYCADLAEDAIEAAGRPRIRPDRRHRLTVEHCYMVI
jgi:hypothetical protein